MTKEMKKIEELAKPIVTFIKEYYDPYVEVVISPDAIKIKQTEIGIPIHDYKDESYLI